MHVFVQHFQLEHFDCANKFDFRKSAPWVSFIARTVTALHIFVIQRINTHTVSHVEKLSFVLFCTVLWSSPPSSVTAMSSDGGTRPGEIF